MNTLNEYTDQQLLSEILRRQSEDDLFRGYAQSIAFESDHFDVLIQIDADHTARILIDTDAFDALQIGTAYENAKSAMEVADEN